MENTSKALLIAATVLVAVLILSFGVYEYFKLENVSKSYSEKASAEQINQFNSKFVIYQSRTEANTEVTTAHDIVSVVNFVKNYNETRDYAVGTKYHITVNVIGVPTGIYSRFETRSDDDQIKFIEQNSINSSGNKINFIVKDSDITYDESGKVNSITFRYKG